MTLAFLQGESTQVLQALVAALAPAQKQKVDGIPLLFEMQSGEVNAFAGCENSQAFMAITSPLLRAMGHIAEAKAADELFGSQRVARYTKLAADTLGAGGQVPDPPANFYTQAESLDPRKLARQRDVFDELVGFVLGHELGHHYLGHTGCANGRVAGAIDPSRLGRIVTSIVPAFNQPNEIASDISGTQNLLNMGAQRSGRAAMTEGGAILTLEFFGSMETLSATTIALGILRTHPHPRLRIPLIQSTAQGWRNSRGQGAQGGNGAWPFPFPFPVPGK